uniref:Transforming growth factor beta regulator 1-like isoform X1 n=1 Tax=Crassostrea virginica TaxID=6565 RepID=A0A8B8ECL1_CRAVI|nr:transforming growth factor beta regulator 1-like isoform X1 [Crassostrea virginica]
MDPNKIFSQNSAFLQQYQADLNKQTSQENPSRQISLLTGKTSQLGTTSKASLLKSSHESPMLSGAKASQPKITQIIRRSHGMSIVKKPPASRVVVQGKPAVPINPYYKRWKRLKKVMKDLMFINASVCDEVVHVEEKIAKVKEERRYLLRKLLHYESLKDGFPMSGKGSPGDSNSKSMTMVVESCPEPVIIKSKSKKKAAGGADKKKPAATPTVTKEMIETIHTKPKKSKSQVIKKVVPPLQLDPMGRPIFPLVIGDLTLHSLGEIVTDRPSFHNALCIFPEGFCTTRYFASTVFPDKKCLYTCKISSSIQGPLFEIDADDDEDLVISSHSIGDCHNQLITMINRSRGMDILEQTGRGADFFGLTHPVIQNLIQSSPGAKRCTNYKWVKFEISKTDTNESVGTEMLQDPTIGYDACRVALIKGGIKHQMPFESTGSLRSLLISKTSGKS